MPKDNLGSFISNKRKERELSLRKLALNSKISVTYLSDIESGRRSNVSKDILENISKALMLNEQEKEKLFTLVGNKNDSIPMDVEEFVKNHPEVVAYLREAKRGEHDKWLKGIEKNGKS